MPKPLDAQVAEMVARLDPDLTEWFEERAAIVEFDAGLTRLEAERLALLYLLHQFPLARSGVVALRFYEGGATRWVLTRDVVRTQRDLIARGMTRLHEEDVFEVLRQHLDDIVFLAEK